MFHPPDAAERVARQFITPATSRPLPYDMARAIEGGLLEGDLWRAWRNGPQRGKRFASRLGRVLVEDSDLILELVDGVISPYLKRETEKLSDEVSKLGESYIIFGGNDAACMYDYYASKNPDRSSVLLPMSEKLNRKLASRYKPAVVKQFLSAYGLSEELIRDNRSLLFVESSIKGDNAQSLDRMLSRAYRIPSLMDGGLLRVLNVETDGFFAPVSPAKISQQPCPVSANHQATDTNTSWAADLTRKMPSYHTSPNGLLFDISRNVVGIEYGKSIRARRKECPYPMLIPALVQHRIVSAAIGSGGL